MNTDTKKSELERNDKGFPAVEGDVYCQSHRSIEDNKSLPSEFKVELQPLEPVFFEFNDLERKNSEYGSFNEHIDTDKTVDLEGTGRDSINSHDSIIKKRRERETKSLPNEIQETHNDKIDTKSIKSTYQPFLRLSSIDLTEEGKNKDHPLEKRNLINTVTKITDDNQNDKDSISNVSNLSKASIVKCNCKKSKCLRLHCICFADLKMCSPLCNCSGCKNNDSFTDIRDFVIEKTKEINPVAFKPKIKLCKGISVNSRGCKCTRNNCLKKYCECYKSRLSCTKLCGCISCKNSKENLSHHDVSDIRDKGALSFRIAGTIGDLFPV